MAVAGGSQISRSPALPAGVSTVNPAACSSGCSSSVSVLSGSESGEARAHSAATLWNPAIGAAQRGSPMSLKSPLPSVGTPADRT